MNSNSEAAAHGLIAEFSLPSPSQRRPPQPCLSSHAREFDPSALALAWIPLGIVDVWKEADVTLRSSREGSGGAAKANPGAYEVSEKHSRYQPRFNSPPITHQVKTCMPGFFRSRASSRESSQPREILDLKVMRKNVATKSFERRPRERMKLGIRALLIIAFATILATSALACPLWLCPMSQGGMPCSDQSSQSVPCPPTVCQASSPYLASHASTHVPIPQVLPAEVVDTTTVCIVYSSADLIRRYEGKPPGLSDPLYLRTHSLLI
jgi:hypothetical protein